MNIWCLRAKQFTSMMLWRFEAARFRVVKYDVAAPLLTNDDYVLLDRKYRPAMESLAGQVQTQDVVIHDQVRNLVWDNYFEIKIAHAISPDTIKSLESERLCIWTYRNRSQAVFVTGDLKSKLVALGKNDFEFSLGFSQFA